MEHVHENGFKMCKGFMMRATDESAGYIYRESFGSEMDFGPRFIIWTLVPWFQDYGFKRIECEHECMFHRVAM